MEKKTFYLTCERTWVYDTLIFAAGILGSYTYGNTAQIAYRESHSKLVCRAASIIPSVRLAGRTNSGCQAGPVSQDQVRQSEQHIQFSGLLPQASVPCLSVSEPTLDDRKYVFHFSANG